MTTRLKILCASLLTLVAFSGEVRAQSEVVYTESFNSYAAESSPPGWAESVVARLSSKRRSVNTPGTALYQTHVDPTRSNNIVFGTANAAGAVEAEEGRYG